MIEYPEYENPNTCMEPMPREANVKECMVFSAAIALTSGAMDTMDRKAGELLGELQKTRANLDVTQFKLRFAEKQEEICGLIAEGKFTIPMQQRSFSHDNFGYHKYTDSQLKVHALGEVCNQTEKARAASAVGIAARDATIVRLESELENRIDDLVIAKAAGDALLHEIDKLKETIKQLRKGKGRHRA